MKKKTTKAIDTVKFIPISSIINWQTGGTRRKQISSPADHPPIQQHPSSAFPIIVHPPFPHPPSLSSQKKKRKI